MRRGKGHGLVRLPPHAPRMRIGLYGGSFDPPHPGHRHVALMALKRLGLDRVWWMVSPGNPLKDRRHLAASAERFRAARQLARHPRMAVTDFETAIDSRFTIESIVFLRRRCPGVEFVFILGADSFASLHRWQAWRKLVGLVPVAVVDRPGWTCRATACVAARALARSRVDERSVTGLWEANPPAWVFLHGPRSNLSSTALRDKLLKKLDGG